MISETVSNTGSTTGTNTSSDVALYGADSTPRLVAVHPIGLDQSTPARVVLYTRTADGQRIETDEAPLYPFFFVSDIELLAGFPQARYRSQPLAGPNPYRHLVVFQSWAAYRDALRHAERMAAQAGVAHPLYLVPNPSQQYLIQTGRTLFKAMGFDDLHRLQLDIEVYSSHGFPQATRPEDEIILIALSDNRGWRHMVDRRTLTEQEMLLAMVALIQERDPDVIEGHNIFAFDFAYIMQRCVLHRVPLAIGRDGRPPRVFPSSIRFAERAIDFPALEIAGRHVVDTYFLVMAFDVIKRDLPGYGLKAAAKYFGFAGPDRTYIAGDDISRVWREQPDLLVEYAFDDVTETERLARHLSGSTFYLSQMVPMPYGQVARTGPAAKIEALFVREYIRQKHALPRAMQGTQTMGGYTDVFLTGIAGPIVYADVESLYPSIMLNYDVRPRQDSLRVFPELLRRLTGLRLEAKRGVKSAATEEARSELDARQNSYKILINSFYGNLGFSLAAFNDFDEADRVARIGQQLLRRIIAAIGAAGGKVIEVDTDGVLFVPPADVQGEAAERALVDTLSAAMPEGIRIGYDGRYQKMLSYKKKNYALLTYDGRLKFKGSSLVSRSSERFGRRFVREAIQLLLNEDLAALHVLYLATRERILAHEWEDVDSFSKTETLKETVDRYVADVRAGKRTRAAAYELAIRRAEETGQPMRKGDRISFYIAGIGSQITSFSEARLASQWNPEAPDENTAYYLKRLDEFARKFEPFFSDHDFRLIFSPEDLFGFDASPIRIVSTETPPAAFEQDETVTLRRESID
ncbi:MAG: DNA polymerase domain-containing protein [Rhodothermales bacterium]|nr:DNA polymerase domain-containing protein [Rhodothermales bacterium]